MKYLILNKEASIGDVTDNAYKGLTATEKKKAIITLLKANPELKLAKAIQKGFIVRVPAISEKAKHNHRNLTDPVEKVTHEMSENLKLFEKTLSKKFINADKRQKGFIKNLKSASSELKKIPNGAETAKILSKYIKESKQSNEKSMKLGIEALNKMQKTIKDFAR